MGVSTQLFAHVIERIFKVRADAVHFIDEGDAWDFVFCGLPPDCLGLRLDAGHTAEHGDCAVEHAHGTLDLSSKIHVPRSVDDVDPMGHATEHLVGAVLFLGPVAGGGGGGNGDAAFAFLLHPIGDGVAVVNVAHFVDKTGVKENALGGGGLAGVNVRRDADVARALHRVSPIGRVDALGGHRFSVFNNCFHLNFQS